MCIYRERWGCVQFSCAVHQLLASSVSVTILYSRSVDPRKLRVGIKYYIVHMYIMPYYTYGSTANFLFLESTALIYMKTEKTFKK